MMTRCSPGKHLYRTPYKPSLNRPSPRHNPIHYFRSCILFFFLLGLLSQKISPYTRTRFYLTSYRHHPTKSLRCPPSKYCSSLSIRSICHMSTSQDSQYIPKKHNPSPYYYNLPRHLFHPPSSRRILRSTIFYCRQSLWFHLLCSHRIPWLTRSYRYFLPICMFTPNTSQSLLPRTPLRVRSSSLILTLRRCSMNFPLYLHLLMRVLNL